MRTEEEEGQEELENAEDGEAIGVEDQTTCVCGTIHSREVKLSLHDFPRMSHCMLAPQMREELQRLLEFKDETDVDMTAKGDSPFVEFGKIFNDGKFRPANEYKDDLRAKPCRPDKLYHSRSVAKLESMFHALCKILRAYTVQMNKSGHQQPNKWDFITCNSKGVYYAWLLWEAAGFLKDLTTKGERLESGQAAANAAPRNRKRKNSVPLNVIPPDEAAEAGDRARDLKQMDTIASWASNTNIDAAVREQANQMMTKFMDKLSKNLDIGRDGLHRWKGKVALVTGATSGIGKAVSMKLAAAGLVVVGAGRREACLEEIRQEVAASGGIFHCEVVDSRSADSILHMFAKVRGMYGGVDVLINSAGVGYKAPLVDGDCEKWREMFEVNVLGLSIATREAVKDMRAQKTSEGCIVHIGSMSAYRIPNDKGGPGFYAATKMAVRALTESLRRELRAERLPIRISCISPGVVASEFSAKYHNIPAGERETHSKDVYGKHKVIQPEDIADAVCYILGAPPHIDVNDILMRSSEDPNI